jgi:hypothetical protein
MKDKPKKNRVARCNHCNTAINLTAAITAKGAANLYCQTCGKVTLHIIPL